MNDSILAIPLARLTVAFLPVALVLVILFRWSLGAGNALFALLRMLVQLLVVGYLLVALFAAERIGLVLLALVVMLGAASWIALRTIPTLRRALYLRTLFAIALGGGATLLLITQGVLALDPWYTPRYVIPLAGMIFATAMTSISLAAERADAEIARGVAYSDARRTAFQAALIPTINGLFAVGVVSLPGMMTGQILGGVSPLIATRYQVMVMCMLLGSAGLATALFLVLARPVIWCNVDAEAKWEPSQGAG